MLVFWKSGQELRYRAGAVHPLDQFPENAWISRYRQLTPRPPHHSAIGMALHDRLRQGKAETDRTFVVHPCARTWRQHRAHVVGKRIRLLGLLDDPLLARTVDQQI